MRFEFATATQIIFGQGTIQEVAPLAAKMGHRAFVITGHSVDRAMPLLEQLKRQGIQSVTFTIPSEPTTTMAFTGAQKAREASPIWLLELVAEVSSIPVKWLPHF